MTAKKVMPGYTPVQQRLKRISLLAKIATGTKVTVTTEVLFLAQALYEIYEGADEQSALDIKARRGERRKAPCKKIIIQTHTGTSEQRLWRLGRIGIDLYHGNPLSRKDRTFLKQALLAIASNVHPNLALGSKARPGENKNLMARRKRINLKYAVPWIATAIEPCKIHPSDVPPMKLKEALEQASNYFGVTYETLQHVWTNSKATRSPVFSI